MKLSFLFLSVFIATIAFSQEKIDLKYLNIKSDFAGQLFYSKEKIKEISIIISTEDMLAALNFSKILDKQPFVKSFNQNIVSKDTLIYRTKLKYHPDMSEIRVFVENTSLEIIFINEKKFWVKSLLTKEEAMKEFVSFKLNDMQWKPEYSNPDMPEYYDYRLFSLKSKLKYMLGGDYAKYLYEGYITKFHDDIDNIIKDKQDYLDQLENK